MPLTENQLFKVQNTILLLGETGVGKSYLAQKIHEKSANQEKAFVNCNLATLSENLIESELFGHIKGAFTGATQNKTGILQFVQDGTLFLDEVGELAMETQKKLLYLLEKKVYRPIGSNHDLRFKGKLIFATNKNLKEMVVNKTFREDLYYRMSIFNFTLPPLRNNPEKVITLLKKFLKESFLKLDSDLLAFLKHHPWHGNIRQLKNLCDYFLELNYDKFNLGYLPDWMVEDKTLVTYNWLNKSYYEAKELFEKEYLHFVLNKYQGRINQTAREIKLSKNTLLSMIKKYELTMS